MSITIDQFYTAPDGSRRDVIYAEELTEEMRSDALETVARANQLIALYEAVNNDTVTAVNSGWRPIEVNSRTPGAAAHSKHTVCRAVDLRDLDDPLDRWLDTPEGEVALEACNLWREAPSATRNWCHVQIVPYASWVEGKSRTFQP